MPPGEEYPDNFNPGQPVHVCLLNPAHAPDCFWLPAGHCLDKNGFKCLVPPLVRNDLSVTLDKNVDFIENAIAQSNPQYLVALSRGVEFAVSYIDRLAKKDDLSKLLGWMVIGSLGPHGYELLDQNSGKPQHQHTKQYSDGISLDADCFEVIDRDTAEDVLLDDVQLQLAWYIGTNDLVDNVAISSAVAQERFGVKATDTDWRHVSPLSHTEEVAQTITDEANNAWLTNLEGR